MSISTFLRYIVFILLGFANNIWADEAVPVSVVLPTISTISESLTFSGSLTAKQHANLSPRVDGLVTEVLVDAGSHVDKGDVLLRLDSAIAFQQHEQANASRLQALATMNEAKRLVKEAQSLIEKDYISDSELAVRQANLELATASYKASQAAQNAARENLQRHQLTAPFSGVIAEKLTETGEWINRSDQILTLVSLNTILLDVKVPQERYADISIDTPVDVLTDTYPNKPLAGEIDALVPVSDPSARAFLIRIVINDPSVQLLPGTSANATFHLSSSGDRHPLSVPRDALLRQPDGSFSLFVVDNEHAKHRHVKVGQIGPEGAVILEGLAKEEPVVVRGNEVLRDGQAVRIVNNIK